MRSFVFALAVLFLTLACLPVSPVAPIAAAVASVGVLLSLAAGLVRESRRQFGAR